MDWPLCASIPEIHQSHMIKCGDSLTPLTMQRNLYSQFSKDFCPYCSSQSCIVSSIRWPVGPLPIHPPSHESDVISQLCSCASIQRDHCGCQTLVHSITQAIVIVVKNTWHAMPNVCTLGYKAGILSGSNFHFPVTKAENKAKIFIKGTSSLYEYGAHVQAYRVHVEIIIVLTS